MSVQVAAPGAPLPPEAVSAPPAAASIDPPLKPILAVTPALSEPPAQRACLPGPPVSPAEPCPAMLLLPPGVGKGAQPPASAMKRSEHPHHRHRQPEEARVSAEGGVSEAPRTVKKTCVIPRIDNTSPNVQSLLEASSSLLNNLMRSHGCTPEEVACNGIGNEKMNSESRQTLKFLSGMLFRF